MLSSIPKIVGVLAVGIPLAHAVDKLQFPSTVTADQPTTLTVNNDLVTDVRAGDDVFRVSLAVMLPGSYDETPICWLVNSTAIDTTTLNITIPADVGPSGQFYRIASKDVDLSLHMGMEGYSSTVSSDSFTLQGGTADWSPNELETVSFGGDRQIPCTSYNCVRNCTIHPSYQDMTAAEREDEEKTVYTCMASCPGISVPSWDELNDGYGYYDDGSDYDPDYDEGDDEDWGDLGGEDGASLTVVTISGTPVAVPVASASAFASGYSYTSDFPASASAEATGAFGSSPFLVSTASQPVSTAEPTAGTSNSTVPRIFPNAANEITAGIPMLFSLLAGILLI